MVKNTIKVYGRVKPIGGKRRNQNQDSTIIGGPEGDTLTITAKVDANTSNNKQDTFNFRFGKVFDDKICQAEVFEVVAKPIVNSVLGGYNGTVFAYGQTGSGKTFTITGDKNIFDNWGLIPRTINYIFAAANDRSDYVYKVHVSYIEIYNECAYDLLDPKHEISKLEDLPKVLLMEDPSGNLQFKNLSIHYVEEESEALKLLCLGDNHRMVSETPMNPCSSRSHCVFTMHVMATSTTTPIIRYSKMHFVDLAGSERVYKSGLDGISLREARHINKTLHFLEQVIVALGEQGRSHVPYRNSVMTLLLRDSLGGNCLTAMIATLSSDTTNVAETISTCRFAQRVSLVSNDAILNEERNLQLEIDLLKQEVKKLKLQLDQNLMEEQDLSQELSSESKAECKDLVSKILLSDQDISSDCVFRDPRKVALCFKLFKDAFVEAKGPCSNEISILLPQLCHLMSPVEQEWKTAQTVKKSYTTIKASKNICSVHIPRINLSKAKEILSIFFSNQENDEDFVNLLTTLKYKYLEAKKLIFIRSKAEGDNAKDLQGLDKNSNEALKGCNNNHLKGVVTEVKKIASYLENIMPKIYRNLQNWWSLKKSKRSSGNACLEKEIENHDLNYQKIMEKEVCNKNIHTNPSDDSEQNVWEKPYLNQEYNVNEEIEDFSSEKSFNISDSVENEFISCKEELKSVSESNETKGHEDIQTLSNSSVDSISQCSNDNDNCAFSENPSEKVNLVANDSEVVNVSKYDSLECLENCDCPAEKLDDIPLSGYPDIDKEIIEFYRSKGMLYTNV